MLWNPRRSLRALFLTTSLSLAGCFCPSPAKPAVRCPITDPGPVPATSCSDLPDGTVSCPGPEITALALWIARSTAYQRQAELCLAGATK